MKPKLVHNWPHVKEENDELSSKILNLTDEYTALLKERKRNREEISDKEKSGLNINKEIGLRESIPMLSEEENYGNLFLIKIY